jgi:hypothetical protein
VEILDAFFFKWYRKEKKFIEKIFVGSFEKCEVQQLPVRTEKECLSIDLLLATVSPAQWAGPAIQWHDDHITYLSISRRW